MDFPRNQVLLLLLISVVLAFLTAGANGQLKLPSYKMKDYPYGKVFANPNQQWHYARNCLRNQSSESCPELDGKGGLNVTTKDAFCGVCSDQMRVVLRCIDLVKEEFLFSNNASTDDVRTAIDTGCSSGNFTIVVTPKSVGTKLGASVWMLVTFLVLLIFLDK